MGGAMGKDKVEDKEVSNEIIGENKDEPLPDSLFSQDRIKSICEGISEKLAQIQPLPDAELPSNELQLVPYKRPVSKVNEQASDSISLENNLSPNLVALEMPVVNEMPTSVVKEIPHSIVKEMPTSVVKEIPHYVVNEMPISVVNEMPITAVNKIPHSVMNEIPISVVNEMSSVNLSPNLDDVLEKSSNRISLPHDMDTTSPIGSFSLNSSSSVEAEDCTILMCVKKNPSKEKEKKSVFIRTLRSGKVFYSDGDRMSRRSKFSPGPSTRMTKVVCHKVRDDVTKSKAPMIESEPSEGDKDCPSDQEVGIDSSDSIGAKIDVDMELEMDDMIVDDIPDDMTLSHYLPKNDRKRKECASPKVDKKKRKKTNDVDISELPQSEFPKSYVRGAKHSHCLLQNRCCYSGYMNAFLLVKNKLPNDFYNCIKQLGFGHFLKDVEVVVNPFHLDDLVGRYIGDHKFAIKSKVLEMTVSDVGHILGIPYDGASICIDKEDEINYWTPFWEKFFNDTQVTSTMIKDVFKETVRKNSKDPDYVEDICRLWFCMLLSCFLIPTTRTVMPIKIFHYLERFDYIPRFNWAALIFNQIFTGMEKASNSVRRRERIGGRVTEYVHGCALVMNVFLWEHTPLFRPSSPRNSVIFQRYEGCSKRRARTIESLDDTQVNCKALSYDLDETTPEVTGRRLK